MAADADSAVEILCDLAGYVPGAGAPASNPAGAMAPVVPKCDGMSSMPAAGAPASRPAVFVGPVPLEPIAGAPAKTRGGGGAIASLIIGVASIISETFVSLTGK